MTIAIPDRLTDRPRSKGAIVPYTADSTDDAWGTEGGTVDFKRASPVRWAECVEDRLCGMCGQRLGYWLAFIGGPRSVESRSFLDPAMHIECAEYALAVCPFLIGTADYGGEDAERTIDPDDRLELGELKDDDERRKVALFVTRSFEQRQRTRKVLGAPRVEVYLYAAPAKRLEWHERGGTGGG